tara:strand:- start:146 stop:448 length:303 start_codon:yes stop_codon:yes gene_type:complete
MKRKLKIIKMKLKIQLTQDAIILEDGFVYHKLSNGDYTDGDNLFKARLFDYDKMTADIDSDPWKFSYYNESFSHFDRDRYSRGQEFIKELIECNDLPINR